MPPSFLSLGLSCFWSIFLKIRNGQLGIDPTPFISNCLPLYQAPSRKSGKSTWWLRRYALAIWPFPSWSLWPCWSLSVGRRTMNWPIYGQAFSGYSAWSWRPCSTSPKFGKHGNANRWVHSVSRWWCYRPLVCYGNMGNAGTDAFFVGTALFVYSLMMLPGSNWTAWITYLVTGLLQGTLLTLCIIWHFKNKKLGINDLDGSTLPQQQRPDEHTRLLDDDAGHAH